MQEKRASFTAAKKIWADHPLLINSGISLLGAPMHNIGMQSTLSLATEAMRKRIPMHHVVVNVGKIVSMQDDSALYEDVAGADVINIDGAGVVFGGRLLRHSISERVAGIDVMLGLFDVCERNGFRVFLLGATDEVLRSVLSRLDRDHPSLQIAGFRNGYFDMETEIDGVVDLINSSGTDCLFVAMPSPQKEKFLHRNRERLCANFVMGVGGSFDVYGGKVKRAPVLWQKLGFEWLYRLLQEPRRLWRRYLITNTRFVLLVLGEWTGWRRSVHNQ